MEVRVKCCEFVSAFPAAESCRSIHFSQSCYFIKIIFTFCSEELLRWKTRVCPGVYLISACAFRTETRFRTWAVEDSHFKVDDSLLRAVTLVKHPQIITMYWLSTVCRCGTFQRDLSCITIFTFHKHRQNFKLFQNDNRHVSFLLMCRLHLVRISYMKRIQCSSKIDMLRVGACEFMLPRYRIYVFVKWNGWRSLLGTRMAVIPRARKAD